MSDKSAIEWTDATWNPVTGCTKVSPGCKHCYAERLALRLKAMGNRRYTNGFELTLHEDVITKPLRWKKPRMIFVNSMSDLFHEDVPWTFIRQVFEVMRQCPQHIFQVLTKRAEVLSDFSYQGIDKWPENVWAGVSVENEKYTNRIRALKFAGVETRFLSCEPLLGPLPNLDLEDIDWVIVGGESGPGARPMDPDWAREIRDACIAQGVPFFFKQWGGVQKKRAGRVLDERTWDEMPEHEVKHG